jgi:hypothetical protein
MQRNHQLMEPLAHLEHVSHRMPMETRAAFGRAADIATGAERAPAACDNQHPHVVVLPREIDRRAHLLDHRLVVAVHPLGAVDNDLRYAIARPINNCLEFHRPILATGHWVQGSPLPKEV